ncbi:UDP-3-O-acyl-N-acetylglucosamine deacetylase [Cyanobium sp. CH-040]|uniref:UDP-3-O-acyl-N-acetylglucosamine deacetylase n=1 Tax=Cyanobium sp. CH-040 TaxID=2823708 RepID=UPI0020CBA4EE|nr:UDP-3-O-acyl-N-acetylglucosamine deacetylase [Cyanobium sp. CH-040]MCP9928936.1 UDP-3-O-acyl-N-acetylglucosamine deacetylase [Cyanobium sp. CH-040]
MTQWPADYAGSLTLAAEVELTGVGLHSGASCRLRLLPSQLPGYRLGWLDEAGSQAIPLAPAQVCETTLCTALQVGQRRLATVEHLLAALAGTGVTQVEIRVEGPEVPLLDGSALPWVDAIASAGLQPLAATSDRRQLHRPITVHDSGGFVTAVPAPQPHLGAAIEFTEPAIGRQVFSLALTPQAFVAEIAPARTFGLRSQVDQLRAAGLIRGGALDNALVCDGPRWLNPPLRYPDEPVRHKILDLLGDLALVGLPRAQVFAFRGSHRLHTDLARAVAAALADAPALLPA